MYLLRLALAGLTGSAIAYAIATVRAEDFTGFYAGVNAGYAFNRDRGGSAGSHPAANDEAAGLPPSAMSASRSPAMRGRRPERTAPR